MRQYNNRAIEQYYQKTIRRYDETMQDYNKKYDSIATVILQMQNSKTTAKQQCHALRRKYHESDRVTAIYHDLPRFTTIHHAPW